MALILALIAVGVSGWIAWRTGTQIYVANAVASHTLCEGAFISHVAPPQHYADAILSERGQVTLQSRRHYSIDWKQHTVQVDWEGHFREVSAFRTDLGCVVLHSQRVPLESGTTTQAGSLKGDASNSPNDLAVAAPTPEIEAAVADAFAEPVSGPSRRTKAVVILHDGKIVGERYAVGYNADTPIMGYSVSKSILSALIGILVKQGKLSLYEPAPVAEWSHASDPRHAITIDELLRMTSGLSLEESDSGLDPVSQAF